MALWIGLAALVAVALLVVLSYNGLVAKRNRVANAWSQIDVQLNRRHDLVPNLVDTVKAYFQHERGVLEAVTRARQQAIAAGADPLSRAPAEDALSGALRSVFAVVEGYLQLKASSNVLALQEALTTTENRIAFARQFYNDAVLAYNTARESVPTALIARALGFRPAALFQMDSGSERQMPGVRL